jgi:large subunit ribosomal protein L23
MNAERLSKIIMGPVVAEKATRVAENNNQVVLKVLPNANKTEIKFAVERLFDVKVAAVNTSSVKGKTKRTGRTFGKRSDWKKAYVTLVDGADLNFLGE